MCWKIWCDEEFWKLFGFQGKLNKTWTAYFSLWCWTNRKPASEVWNREGETWKPHACIGIARRWWMVIDMWRWLRGRFRAQRTPRDSGAHSTDDRDTKADTAVFREKERANWSRHCLRSWVVISTTRQSRIWLANRTHNADSTIESKVIYYLEQYELGVLFFLPLSLINMLPLQQNTINNM